MTPPESYLEAVEAELRRHVVLRPDSPPLLLGMIRYHMGWVDQDFRPIHGDSGKRVRPVLLLLATAAAGGQWTQALPAAAAVELLHNFTLIHDDIEDRDTVRRGRPTLWSLWGVPQAINAGDTLYAVSYRALLALSDCGVDPSRVVTAIQRFTEGVIGITEGQCLDLAFEDVASIDERTYLTMVEGKTGRLLGLSAELGAIVAGAAPAVTDSLREFGHALGMAFQMADDVLGLWGDPRETGKPVGSDLRKRKKTLPILHGMAHSVLLRDLLAWQELGSDDVQRAMDALVEAGSRAYTEERASQYHRQACEALDRVQIAGSAHDALAALANTLHGRRR